MSLRASLRTVLAAVLAGGAVLAQSPVVLQSLSAEQSGNTTIVRIVASADVEYLYDRLRNPDRIYVDLIQTVPKMLRGIGYGVPVGDARVRQMRVGINKAGVTRIVIDLEGPFRYSVNRLDTPGHMEIIVRGADSEPAPEPKPFTPPPAASPAAPAGFELPAPVATNAESAPPLPSGHAEVQTPKRPAKPFVAPPEPRRTTIAGVHIDEDVPSLSRSFDAPKQPAPQSLTSVKPPSKTFVPPAPRRAQPGAVFADTRVPRFQSPNGWNTLPELAATDHAIPEPKAPPKPFVPPPPRRRVISWVISDYRVPLLLPPEDWGERPDAIALNLDPEEPKRPPKTFVPPPRHRHTPAAPARIFADARVPPAQADSTDPLPPPRFVREPEAPQRSVPSPALASTATRLDSAEPPALSPPAPKPADADRFGRRSLTRVLGLKPGRIVLDAGHGGHDHGTSSRSGLKEKDVVLDIALRLGELIEQRLGAEVIYTRKDDTFVVLEQRARIANDAKADLFLSIHANSSPIRSIAGVETYYLNFSQSREDLDLAARENAGSQHNISDLSDLVKKIALQDKLDESREFAGRVQSASHQVAAAAGRTTRNRGVKKAPFVVLIGAEMPAVLTEVAFLSNPNEESLMKQAEHRQQIAEGLFKGIAKYTETLSRFDIARRDEE
jgi:N-acetylmuramoyl-L-alanine amidase